MWLRCMAWLLAQKPPNQGVIDKGGARGARYPGIRVTVKLSSETVKAVPRLTSHQRAGEISNAGGWMRLPPRVTWTLRIFSCRIAAATSPPITLR